MATKRKNPHAVALGRRGGLASAGKTSAAKAKASAANGKLGGRPRTSPRGGLRGDPVAHVPPPDRPRD